MRFVLCFEPHLIELSSLTKLTLVPSPQYISLSLRLGILTDRIAVSVTGTRLLDLSSS